PGETGAGPDIGRAVPAAGLPRRRGRAAASALPPAPGPLALPPGGRPRLRLRGAASLLGLGLRHLRVGGVGGNGVLRAHADCCRAWGGATSLRILLITLFAVVPANSASGSSTNRCSQTGSTSCLTSSGMT